MLDKVARTVERNGMLPPGARVGVAVSGGADSVCLLHALLELAPRWDLRLSVLHLNHKLRGEESDGDARFVRELAARLGLPYFEKAVDVAAIEDNLEQAARRARQAFFGELLAREVERVATGHTMSDQAETVLFRFLRGSGGAGLAGIRAVTAEGVVRPLIEVRRDEVVEFLKARGAAWREDSSNQDRRFARNRIRHELLPALERDWNPALDETLARMAEVAGDEEAFWERLVDQAVEGRVVAKAPAALIPAGWLAGLDPAVGRRVARRAISMAKGDLRAVDMRHIEGILALAREEKGSGRLQIPGIDVFRSYDWLRLARPAPGRREYEMAVEVPGRYEMGGGWVLEVFPTGYNEEEPGQLDCNRISGGLGVRNWRPGDRYQPLEYAAEIPIKSLFERARVPVWDRREWPVMTAGEKIVWAGGFGASAEAAATPGSARVVTIRETHDLAQFCNLGIGRRRLKSEGSFARARGEGGL